MSEHKIQTAIFNYLVAIGCLVIRVNSGSRGVIRFVYWMMTGRKKQSTGVSDILAVTPTGRFLAVECKDAGKNPTPEQVQFLDGVKERGGLAVVAHSVEDVEQVIDTGAETR